MVSNTKRKLNILCIIPARRGSKSLKNKNIIPIFSKPLIGYTIEAAHLLNEGIAEVTDIDQIMRVAAGFPMGPFELMDLTAIDVTQPATELIYEQFFHEPRYRALGRARALLEGATKTKLNVRIKEKSISSK